MGLQKDVFLNGEVIVSNAYHKIHTIKLGHNNGTIIIKAYKNKNARDKNILNYLSADKQVSIDLNSDFFINNIAPLLLNLKKKLYGYIKTLPEYADVVDVLEEV